jgi:glycerol uptake facilitator-like aquaporin
MNGTLTIAVVAIGALLILKFAKKIFSKIVGVVVIGGGVLFFMYKYSMGPFKNNVADISALQEKYCSPQGDQDICECIITPLRNDIEGRFSAGERDSLRQQKIKAAYVLQKSLRATKEAALACLALKSETDKYSVFIKDLVPVENKYLDVVGNKARDLGEKLKEEVSNFKNNKDDIDGKY